MDSAFLKGIRTNAAALESLLKQDLAKVEVLLADKLRSEVPSIQKWSDFILAPKGKRLRPALLILSAGRPGASSDTVLLAGAVVEMIHAATLLHDDVVDSSQRRRGLPTLNARGGDATAVLMGDYVYSRAITLLVEAELTQVLAMLAWTVHRMSVGELLQLELSQSRLLDEDAYRRVIFEKTARLIEACCRSGAVLAGASPAAVEALGEYGRNVGMAFQIVDDVLDYSGDALTLGKPAGSDLLEGKLTLPLLKTFAASPAPQRARLVEMLARVEDEREAILALVREGGGAEAAMADAAAFGAQARRALSGLPPGVTREALDAAVDFVIERRY